MGVVFVQDVLGASTLQFGVLVALFGVGAAGAWRSSPPLGRADLQVVRLCVAAQGIVVAAMSQAPSILAAFAGAVLFGAATAAGLAAAMSVLQAGLGERDRVLAFTAFHVVIRGGLDSPPSAPGSPVTYSVGWNGQRSELFSRPAPCCSSPA